ncbi:MAG: hypothetical protein RRA94_08995 [Bacteroidota bacterium]|nr:hypothetical protein [Bacteroidota bacterium]
MHLSRTHFLLIPLFVAVLLSGVMLPALHAQTVRGLVAWHYSGQTFLTWESAGDAVQHYTVYRSRRPLRTALALQQAEERFIVAPGQSYNRRLSATLGIPVYYRLPGPGGALDFTDEYFVVTGGVYGTWYYAVTVTGTKGEIRLLREGRNTVTNGVLEYLAIPSPAHQGRFQIAGGGVDIFVHWGSSRALPGMPAMSNRHMQPFLFALRKNGGARSHPLLVRLHGRTGSFLYQTLDSGNPQEYVLSLDDALPGAVKNTFWFGYDSTLVIDDSRLRPAAITRVRPYTARRVAWTMEWALRKLPVDPTRVIVSGTSMGGSGAAFSIFNRDMPVAAALALIPRLDFRVRDLADAPRSGNAFQHFDALWGSVERRPRLDDGSPLYDRLDFALRLQRDDLRDLPHLRVISGAQDSIVGFRQTWPAMRSADRRHAGITFFWDERGHDTGDRFLWTPMENIIDLSRYRADRSWPAFSGDSEGDPVQRRSGSRNARAAWFEPVVDLPGSWSVGLRRRPLEQRDSLSSFPMEIVVDVTPRRLQRFRVEGGTWYDAELTRAGRVVFQATVRAVRDGELTVPGVPLSPDPARLELRPSFGPVLPR